MAAACWACTEGEAEKLKPIEARTVRPDMPGNSLKQDILMPRAPTLLIWLSNLTVFIAPNDLENPEDQAGN